MSDVSAKLENVDRMDEGWRVQARKAARREVVVTEAERHTVLLEEIRAILARLLAIAEYKAPRS